MSAILAKLKQQQENVDMSAASSVFIEFSQFFTSTEGRQGVVVTFLAILELIKESLITCVQSEIYGQIQISLPSSTVPIAITNSHK